MNSLNHIVGGVAVAAIAGAVEGIDFYRDPLLVAATIAAALAPDIDKPGAIAFNCCPPLGNFIHRRWGHRTVTHGLPAVFLVALAAHFLAPPDWAFFLPVGYASHLLLDLLTVSGIPPFSPFSDKTAVLPALAVSTKNPTAQWIYTGLFSVAVVASYGFARHGFWATYNQGFSTPRHVASEMRKTPFAVLVDYAVRHGSDTIAGQGFAVAADENSLSVFDPLTGFHAFAAPDYVFLNTVPHRTDTRQTIEELPFSNVSLDSLNSLILARNLVDLEITANCDFTVLAVAASPLPPSGGGGGGYRRFAAPNLAHVVVAADAASPARPAVDFLPSARAHALRARARRIRAAYDRERRDWLRQQRTAENLLSSARSEADFYKKTKMVEHARRLEKLPEPNPVRDQLDDIADQLAQAETEARRDFVARKEKADADFLAKLPEPPRFSGRVKSIRFDPPLLPLPSGEGAGVGSTATKLE